MDAGTFIALNRFGLGRRPDDALPADPRDWLRAQLADQDPQPARPSDRDALPDNTGALAILAQQGAMGQQRKLTAPAAPRLPGTPAPAPAADMPHPVADLARQEMHALLGRALLTDAPFRERLVWFWSNHFTVALPGVIVAACSGAYVREAIRPHVTGRFADMLLAVMRHPAMLAYLNQERSAGPNSRAGQRPHVGLNENLARESLELHTITPAAGYTQADVTAYARILTGWSIELREPPTGFRFRPFLHEPGEIEVMDRTWPAGEQGGVAILAWLGTHPATYRHLAEKLVRHFVADDPPTDQVARIATVLRETDGDLSAASAALVDLPGAWVPGAKLRTPQEFVIASLRAIGATPEQFPNLAGIVARLGQGVFQAPFPIGWPDRAADWAGPEAMLQRVDYAYGLSARAADTDPDTLGHALLGPLLTDTTLTQIRAAGSRREGLTLLLSSPEFQRR